MTARSPGPTHRGADGAVLAYDVLGAGLPGPLLALAGGAAADPGYLGDLAGLPYELVVPHVRGAGRSAGAPLSPVGSFWEQAGDLDRLRDHLGLVDCVVVGHSAGTRLAIAYACRFPDRVAALVLVTPPSRWVVGDVDDTGPSDPRALLGSRRGEPAVAAALDALDRGPDLTSEDTFNRWQQEIAPSGYAAWGPVEQAHARSVRYHPVAARAFLDGEVPDDVADRLSRLEVPVLVVAGAHDATTGVRPVEALAGLFPDGRLEVVEDCGHFPFVEQPRAFRAAVDPFLASVVGSEQRSRQ